MTEKESLLDFIKRIESEARTIDTFGIYWKGHEYRARRSHVAGEICLLFAQIERLKAKATNRPKSTGARKARREMLASVRKLEELEKIVNESMEDYRKHSPTKPEYYTEPLNFINLQTEGKVKFFKKPLEIPLPHSMT